MDDGELWDWLVAELTEGAEVTVYPGGSGGPVTYRATHRAEVLPGGIGIRITCFNGRDLEPPMILHVDPPALAARLRAMAGTAVEAFGTRREEGLVEAFQLFLIHLEEAVETRRPDETHLVLRDDGFDSLTGPEGWPPA